MCSALTEGQVEQAAVRCVHVIEVHVVLLCWPVYAVIWLSVELLGRGGEGSEVRCGVRSKTGRVRGGRGGVREGEVE